MKIYIASFEGVYVHTYTSTDKWIHDPLPWRNEISTNPTSILLLPRPLWLGQSLSLSPWLPRPPPSMGSVGWDSVVSNALGSAAAGMLSRLVTHPLGECIFNKCFVELNNRSVTFLYW